MSEDNTSDMELPEGHGEALGGGTTTISAPELEAAVERVMRRLGVQTRNEGGSAPPGRAVPGTTPPTAETPPVTSTPMTSGAGAGLKRYFICIHNMVVTMWDFGAILGNGYNVILYQGKEASILVGQSIMGRSQAVWQLAIGLVPSQVGSQVA